MTDEQEKRLDWARGILREPPALPEGFLQRFEERLLVEPAPTRSIRERGGITSSGRPTRTRQLMAALILLVALAGLVWTLPRDNSPRKAGLVVVATGQDAKLNRNRKSPTPLQTLVELAVDDTLETGSEGSVVLMAGSPGNEIKVGPESRVRIGHSRTHEDPNIGPELQLSAGVVFVAETDVRISVRTSHALFQPVGTDYRVTSSVDSTTLSVLEGVVNATPVGGGQPITVRAGEQLVVGGAKTRSEALRTRKLSDQELEPLRQERQSFGKLKQTPSLGGDPSPYPKAVKKKPTRPGNLSSLPRRADGRTTRITRSSRPSKRPVRKPATKPVRASMTRRAEAARARNSQVSRPGRVLVTAPSAAKPRVRQASSYPRARVRPQGGQDRLRKREVRARTQRPQGTALPRVGKQRIQNWVLKKPEGMPFRSNAKSLDRQNIR